MAGGGARSAKIEPVGLKGLVIGVALVVGAAIMPAPASAASEFELSASLPKQDGKRLTFDIDNGTAGLTVAERNRRYLRSSSYFTLKPKVRLRRHAAIDVDLGTQGFVHAKFVERSRSARPAKPSQCNLVRDHRGYLVGRILFRGIPGVDVVRTHRIKATLTEYRDVNCPVPIPDSAADREVSLAACNATSDAFYSVFPAAERGATKVVHFALSFEQTTKRTVVSRSAFRADNGGSFQFTPDLLDATVRPGYPFSGSATFADERLTGDLAVEFLGLRAPLAITPGPAQLRRTKSVEIDTPCRFGGVDPDELISPVGTASPAPLPRLGR